jgi:6,7-dimethyl-8-ribityllumazine synthase
MTTKPTILIVEARFYTEIADQLAEGAIKALDAAGYEHERLAVPGVFEVPAAIRMALRSMEIHSSSRSYAGFIALGCVIRGETSHYDYVCSESSRADGPDDDLQRRARVRHPDLRERRAGPCPCRRQS